jgi:cytochrome c
VLSTVTLTATGDPTIWASQVSPLVDPGGPHQIYLVFRSIPGGQTGNNLFVLNWAEFGGEGVSDPPGGP